MSTPTNVLVAGRLFAHKSDELRDLLETDWTVHSWDSDTEPFEAFHERIAEADVIVAGKVGGDWLPQSRLQLYQIPFAGHDFINPDDLPPGCVLCNTYEHEGPIAEYVLLAMLDWEIGYCRTASAFKAHSWQGRSAGDGPTHGELAGRTVGIIGYGHIAREVAHRAAALGCRTVAVTRTKQPTPAPLDWLGTSRDLNRLLAESDYVVIACPLTEATRGLLGETQFFSMKPSGVVINVSRGDIIDEESLYQALKDRRIGGAVIDVWYRYPDKDDASPWPSRFPFQELDNIVMTPHYSGWTQAQIDRRWRFVAANLDRFQRGEPLQNVVFGG